MRRVVLALFTAFALLSGLTVSASAQDVDCPDLSYQEAQDILAQDPSDPNRLDADNDGIACETNAGGGSDEGTSDDSGSDDGTTGDSGSEDDVETSDLPEVGTGPAADAGVTTSVLMLASIAGLLAMAGLRIGRRA